MKTDGEIQKGVEEQLRGDPDIDAADIAVAVHYGIVTLKGHVRSYMQKTQAERDAKRVAGTLGLANDIEVRLPYVNKWPDPEIARDSVEKLWKELPYSSQFINVTTDEGWLTLEGRVEWNYQRDRAEQALREVRGVIGVANEITLSPKVAASDVKRKVEEELKRNAEIDPRSTAQSLGSKPALRGSMRSWAERTDAERSALGDGAMKSQAAPK